MPGWGRRAEVSASPARVTNLWADAVCPRLGFVQEGAEDLGRGVGHAARGVRYGLRVCGTATSACRGAACCQPPAGPWGYGPMPRPPCGASQVDTPDQDRLRARYWQGGTHHDRHHHQDDDWDDGRDVQCGRTTDTRLGGFLGPVPVSSLPSSLAPRHFGAADYPPWTGGTRGRREEADDCNVGITTTTCDELNREDCCSADGCGDDGGGVMMIMKIDECSRPIPSDSADGRTGTRQGAAVARGGGGSFEHCTLAESPCVDQSHHEMRACRKEHVDDHKVTKGRGRSTRRDIHMALRRTVVRRNTSDVDLILHSRRCSDDACMNLSVWRVHPAVGLAEKAGSPGAVPGDEAGARSAGGVGQECWGSDTRRPLECSGLKCQGLGGVETGAHGNADASGDSRARLRQRNDGRPGRWPSRQNPSLRQDPTRPTAPRPESKHLWGGAEDGEALSVANEITLSTSPVRHARPRTHDKHHCPCSEHRIHESLTNSNDVDALVAGDHGKGCVGRGVAARDRSSDGATLRRPAHGAPNADLGWWQYPGRGRPLCRLDLRRRVPRGEACEEAGNCQHVSLDGFAYHNFDFERLHVVDRECLEADGPMQRCEGHCTRRSGPERPYSGRRRTHHGRELVSLGATGLRQVQDAQRGSRSRRRRTTACEEMDDAYGRCHARQSSAALQLEYGAERRCSEARYRASDWSMDAGGRRATSAPPYGRVRGRTAPRSSSPAYTIDGSLGDAACGSKGRRVTSESERRTDARGDEEGNDSVTTGWRRRCRVGGPLPCFYSDPNPRWRTVPACHCSSQRVSIGGGSRAEPGPSLGVGEAVPSVVSQCGDASSLVSRAADARPAHGGATAASQLMRPTHAASRRRSVDVDTVTVGGTTLAAWAPRHAEGKELCGCKRLGGATIGNGAAWPIVAELLGLGMVPVRTGRQPRARGGAQIVGADGMAVHEECNRDGADRLPDGGEVRHGQRVGNDRAHSPTDGSWAGRIDVCVALCSLVHHLFTQAYERWEIGPQRERAQRIDWREQCDSRCDHEEWKIHPGPKVRDEDQTEPVCGRCLGNSDWYTKRQYVNMFQRWWSGMALGLSAAGDVMWRMRGGAGTCRRHATRATDGMTLSDDAAVTGMDLSWNRVRGRDHIVEGRNSISALLLFFAHYLPSLPRSSPLALGNAEPQGLLGGPPWAPVEEIQRDPARPQRSAGRGIARMTGIQGVATVPACGGSADPPTPAVRPNGTPWGSSARVPPPLFLLSLLLPPFRRPALEIVRRRGGRDGHADDASADAAVLCGCLDDPCRLHGPAAESHGDNLGRKPRMRRNRPRRTRKRRTFRRRAAQPNRAKWVGGRRIAPGRRTHRRLRLGRRRRAGRVIWIERNPRPTELFRAISAAAGATYMEDDACGMSDGCDGGDMPNLGDSMLDHTDGEEECDPRTYLRKTKPTIRVGEAQNPGPRSSRRGPMAKHGAATYRQPHRPGFHGAMMPDDANGGSGQSDGRQVFELTIETANATSWGSMKRYLRSTPAHLVLAQEHHLGPEAILAASAWALRRGWRSVFAPAVKGDGSGWKAGVAIFARDELGLSMPRVGSHVITPGRAVAALLEAPGYRPCTVVSIYLEDGAGLSAANLAHLEAVGNCIAAQGDDMPFVAGGDMQMDPSVLAAAGFATRTNSVMVASRDPRGTCRTSRTATELDYFFVHEDMAKGLKSVRAVNDNPITRPHVPVRITFHPRLVTARALTLRMPPRLPTERVVGPVPPPPDWSDVQQRTRQLLQKVRDTTFTADDDFRREYSQIYTEWADLAELEVVDAVKHEQAPKKMGLRGREPELVWRSILPERPPAPTRLTENANRWRTAGMLVQEIRAALCWLVPEDDDGDDHDHHPRADERDDVPRHDAHDLHARPDLAPRVRGIREQLDAILDGLQASDGAVRPTSTQDGQDEDTEHAQVITELRTMTCAIEVAVASAQGRAQQLAHDYDHVTVAKRIVHKAEEAYHRIQRAADAAMRKEEAAHVAEWRSWVAEGIASGARHAHRFLKLPVEWRPTTTLQCDGVVTADPLKLLEGYVGKYDRLWNSDAQATAEGGAKRTPWSEAVVEPLPRPTPEEIRAASRSFSHRTAVTFDGFAMRHYELMSDDALSLVADHVEIMERSGEMPPQLAMVPMPMLEKPRGGHRAIANFASLYRLWTRLRREVVRQWEHSNEREYFAAGKGRSPHDTVWRQAARAEAAVSRGEQSAAVLWDLASFFETIRREPLWHKARRLGFPPAVAKVAFHAYEATRCLSISGVIARPLAAADGVPAGCGMAMAFTRAYVTEAFDRVTAKLADDHGDAVRLDVYVDDVCLSAVGKSQRVIRALSEAAEDLKRELEGPLRCTIETDKAAVVASSRALRDALRCKFGRYAGPDGPTSAPDGRRVPAARGRRRSTTRSATPRQPHAAPNLGIDFAPGCMRRWHNASGRRAARLNKLNIKVRRLARIRTIAGRRTPNIFMAGPLPEAVYGAAVNGLSDKEVLRVRRAAALSYSPRAKGRSLTRLLAIVGIPTWRAEVEVVLQYAKEVWAAALLGHHKPSTGQLTLADISRLWHAVNPLSGRGGGMKRAAWDSARGPITAMGLSLRRVGWSMTSPFVFVNADREEVPLTKVSPGMLAHMLREAVLRQHQRLLGDKLADVDPTFAARRVATEHIDARLRTDKTLTAQDKAAYRAVACDAVMTCSKARKLGYDIPDQCPLCGHAGDTQFHRIWKCRHPDAVKAREEAAPSWLLKEVERLVDADKQIFWTTAFFPHPADIWPKPAVEANAVVEWCGADGPGDDDRDGDGRPQVQGQLYIDGSCSTGVFPDLRRASSSIIQWSADEPRGWRMALPVPSPLPQTPQAAEYVALAVVKQYVKRTARADVASDCANVVADANSSAGRALAYKKVYAGIMKEIVSDPSWCRLVTVRKVPAHLSPSALPEGRSRDDAVGNNQADELAKEGRNLHDQPSPAMVTELDAQLKRAKAIIRVIAKVTQCFPPQPKGKMPRRPRHGGAVLSEEPETHQWAHAGGLWRCTRCLRLTLSQEIDDVLATQKCPGMKSSMEAETITARGHALATTTDTLPIIFCVKCGAFSARRARGLAAACPGGPKRSGRQALKMIKQGLQPWVKEGPRGAARGTTSGYAAWDGRIRSFRTCGAAPPSARRAPAACDAAHHHHHVQLPPGEPPQRHAHDADEQLSSAHRMEEDRGAPADAHNPGASSHVDASVTLLGAAQMPAAWPPSPARHLDFDPMDIEEHDVFGHGASLDQPPEPGEARHTISPNQPRLGDPAVRGRPDNEEEQGTDSLADDTVQLQPGRDHPHLAALRHRPDEPRLDQGSPPPSARPALGQDDHSQHREQVVRHQHRYGRSDHLPGHPSASNNRSSVVWGSGPSVSGGGGTSSVLSSGPGPGGGGPSRSRDDYFHAAAGAASAHDVRRGRLQRTAAAACSAAPPARRRRGVDGEAHGVPDSVQADRPMHVDWEGTPIWMRDPQWLYLPHQQEAREGRDRLRAQAHAAEPQCRRNPVPAARPQTPGAALHAGGGEYADREADVRREVHARAGPGASCGRHSSPAPLHDPGADGDRAPPGAVHEFEIRGQGCSPGGGASGGLRSQGSNRRSARDYAARQASSGDEYVLRSALAAHAERVSRRRQRDGGADLAATPAARLAALRRRVATRHDSATSPPAPVASAASLATPAADWLAHAPRPPADQPVGMAACSPGAAP